MDKTKEINKLKQELYTKYKEIDAITEKINKLLFADCYLMQNKFYKFSNNYSPEDDSSCEWKYIFVKCVNYRDEFDVVHLICNEFDYSLNGGQLNFNVNSKFDIHIDLEMLNSSFLHFEEITQEEYIEKFNEYIIDVKDRMYAVGPVNFLE